MQGFSPILLRAFSTMLGYSQHDIMYIILQHIFMFVSQEIGPGACCWHVLLSGSGAGQQKLLDVASMARLSCRLGGWMPQNYSMLTHVKTGGKKILHCVPRLLDPLFQILEFGFKARGLRDTCHRCLFFKFLEDKDQKIED